eukprot:5146805-Lingulodinium_polyedra.AAC.1
MTYAAPRCENVRRAQSAEQPFSNAQTARKLSDNEALVVRGRAHGPPQPQRLGPGFFDANLAH